MGMVLAVTEEVTAVKLMIVVKLIIVEGKMGGVRVWERRES